MKKFYIALAAAAVCFASCNKEVVVTPVNEDVDSHLVQMTFTASTAETKTTLGALSGTEYPVLWSDSDQIKVIAVDAGGTTLYSDIFTIDAGGNSTATFTGTSYADAAAYYAVYPATFSATVSGTGTDATIALSDYKSHDVTAVEGGFDPSRVVMFAVLDNGEFTFKHGVSFFKITIGIDDVSSVEFRVPSEDGGARIFGNPTYKVSDGTTSAYSGADKSKNYVTLSPTSGTLTKGATYYVPFAAKASSLTTYLQLTYTVGANTTSKKTTKLNGTFANGHVYDLGTPPVTFDPSFTASNVTIEAAVESGTINFKVSNLVTGGSVTREVLTGATIANLNLGAVSFDTSTGEGSVPFTCDGNTDTDIKTATVRLTYTYNTNQTVTKDVTITQKKAAAAGSNVYVIYASGGSAIQTANGVDGASYFTLGTATSVISSWNADYACTSATIGGTTYTQAIKLDSKGQVQFTVSSGVSATARFYCVRRKSGDSATVKLRIGAIGATTSDQASVSPEHTTVTDSGSISLTAGTTYTIQQGSKESALFYVEVTETAL